MKNSTTTKPVKFAAGKPVHVTRGGLDIGVGRYVGSEQKANGVWHRVNLAAPRATPDVRLYRAANLAKVS